VTSSWSLFIQLSYVTTAYEEEEEEKKELKETSWFEKLEE